MGLPVSRLEGAAAAAVREAREGRTVEITSRGKVVARIVPAEEDNDIILPSGEPVGLPAPVRLRGEGPSLSEMVLEDRR